MWIPAISENPLITECAPVVELGAGRGYWASLLRAGGTDVVAIDKQISDNPWTEVVAGDVDSLDSYPGHALMMIWPPLRSSMAKDALARYRGNCLIYVGEGADGCCAEPGFFDLLRQDWNLVKHVGIPTWPRIYDGLFLYSRKSN